MFTIVDSTRNNNVACYNHFFHLKVIQHIIRDPIIKMTTNLHGRVRKTMVADSLIDKAIL